jgi:hypothetical protein
VPDPGTLDEVAIVLDPESGFGSLPSLVSVQDALKTSYPCQWHVAARVRCFTSSQSLRSKNACMMDWAKYLAGDTAGALDKSAKRIGTSAVYRVRYLRSPATSIVPPPGWVGSFEDLSLAKAAVESNLMAAAESSVGWS